MKIALAVFAIESAIMLLLAVTLGGDFAGGSGLVHALVDALALSLVAAPVIYFWIVRPYAKGRDAADASLRRQIELHDAARRQVEAQGERLLRLAEENRAAKLYAESANRSKSEFLATMSHELRTPLNAILGFSEIIADEKFGPIGQACYADYARDVNQSGQHLLALINDILDLSKVESGKDELNEEIFDLDDVVESALSLVRQRASRRGVALERRIEARLPKLRADNRKLKQILVNLLSNGVKFTGAGGRVLVEAQRDESGDLLLAVEDTGIGIAAEDIPKALSQFGQVKKDSTLEQEGTGLGLPLAVSLAEQHGGTLELSSEPGVGTRVVVRLPASRLRNDPEPERSEAEASSSLLKRTG